MIDLKEHFAKRQSWLNFALVHKRIDLFIQELQVGWVAARTGSMSPERWNRSKRYGVHETGFVTRIGEREVEIGF
jgi:hypothetical protein